MADKIKKPGKWFYGLAALVVTVGIVLFLVLIFSSISSMTRGLTQIVVPGRQDVEFTKSGTYTIFYEYQSVVGNKVYATNENLPGLECGVIDMKTGQSATLSSPATASNYSLGGRSGRAIFTFTVDHPGQYEIYADYAEGTGPDIVLAVGSDVTLKIVGTVFGAIAILFVSLILGAVIVLVTFLKRKKARRSVSDSGTNV